MVTSKRKRKPDAEKIAAPRAVKINPDRLNEEIGTKAISKKLHKGMSDLEKTFEKLEHTVGDVSKFVSV